MLFSFLKRFKVLVGLLSLFVLGSCFSGLNVSAMEEKKPVAFGEQNKDGLKELFGKAPELISGPIILRQTTYGDIDPLAKILQSYDKTEIGFLYNPGLGGFSSFEDAKNCVRNELRDRKDDGIVYTICDKETKKVLGQITLQFFDVNFGSFNLNKAVQVSIFIDKEFQNQGVGKAALEALCEFLYKFKGEISVFNINCWSKNERMVGLIKFFKEELLKKLGAGVEQADCSFDVPVKSTDGKIDWGDLYVGLFVNNGILSYCVNAVKSNEELYKKIINEIGDQLKKHPEGFCFGDVLEMVVDRIAKDGFGTFLSVFGR